MHHDQQKLNTAGYVTKEFTPYHFEVKKPGGTAIVNVWPTAKKILRKWSPGPAPYYTDIIKAVEQAFLNEPPTIFVDGSMWDEEDPLVKELYKYRADPLAYIRAKTV